MASSKPRVKRSGKVILGAVGLGALVILGVLSAENGGLHIGPGPRLTAGSGSAPTNTVYTQPTVRGMNIGATATTTTPDEVPAVTIAKPAH